MTKSFDKLQTPIKNRIIWLIFLTIFIFSLPWKSRFRASPALCQYSRKKPSQRHFLYLDIKKK